MKTSANAWTMRSATLQDAAPLEALIPVSVRGLQSSYYSAAQMEAAIGPVFSVDRQLIHDGTYFCAESSGQIIASGGWSRRRSLFGGDGSRPLEDELLDPATEPARIRAFFVNPAWARRGLGRALLERCETAIVEAGFHEAQLVATLAGVPLYAAAGFSEVERLELPLPGGLSLPCVRMLKQMTAPNRPTA